MPIDKDGQEVVYQSNELIHMNMDLTLQQWQVFFIAEAQLFPRLTNDHASYDDVAFRTIQIPAAKVYEYFSEYGGSDNRHDLYARIKKACAQMMGLTAERYIPKEDCGGGGFIYINVFESISFTKRDGLTFLFTRSMIPHLLEFWRGYAKIPVNLPFVVTSSYSVKLFMLLMTKSYHAKRHGGKFWLEINLDELRRTLGVPEDAYNDRIDNFFRKVIDKPISEIMNGLPSYDIKREKLKTGRKVTGVRFNVEVHNVIDVAPDAKPKELPAPAPSLDDGVVEPVEVAKPSSEDEQYIRHVSDDCGVAERVARYYVKKLGWQRCKELSDSVEAAGGNAGGIVSAWKNNEPWHAKTKKMATKEPPQKMPIALRNDEMNFA